VAAFACSACGLEITRDLEVLEEPPDPPEELLGHSGDDWVPAGRYLRDAGPWTNLAEVEAGPIVNEADLVNTLAHSDRARWTDGCCGTAGLFGPNVVCMNGHEVATKIYDCYTLNGIWLLPGATMVIGGV